MQSRKRRRAIEKLRETSGKRHTLLLRATTRQTGKETTTDLAQVDSGLRSGAISMHRHELQLRTTRVGRRLRLGMQILQLTRR